MQIWVANVCLVWKTKVLGFLDALVILLHQGAFQAEIWNKEN
jgi:hypothetical protein